ncbi:MAG: PAS domain S-box protein [Euryarchaeota archaeon]|nr:PAS domain S-box protein [Euryarchaeota archaeon]
MADRKDRREPLETEEHFRAVMDSAIDALVSIDAGGRIIFWNPSAERMFGYTPEEAVGNPVTLIIPERYREVHSRALKQVTSGGKPGMTGRVYQVEGLKKDGGEVPVELSLARWEAGGEVFFTGIIRDITKRKEAEDALMGYTEEIEESNRMMQLFTDIMRHDLLNPAGVIQSFTELLLEKEDDPEKRDILETIQGAAARLVAMIENASRYSKLESMEEIECRDMDLGAVLEEAVDDLAHLIEERGMTLDNLARGRYPAWVNPMVKDVFTNLISNAIKYSPPGSRITVDIRDEDGDWLFYVRDRGEGVPDEFKERLFTRFERLGKEGVKGTGLGLAIVKRLVELHRGRVWVEDNPGGGSIFYVSLPKPAEG